MSSVRNRLFVLIAGTAVLASLSIGVAYLATETERLDARAETHTVADLYGLTVLLSNSIRDQDEAVGNYLLASAPEALDRYAGALENELHLAERMRLAAADDPDIVAALETLEARSRAWRATFAAPAIAAVSAGSPAQVARFVETVYADKEPTLTGIYDLVSRISETEASAAAHDDALTRTRALANVFGIALMLLAAAASLGMARRWVHPSAGQAAHHGGRRRVRGQRRLRDRAQRRDRQAGICAGADALCAPAGRGSLRHSQPLHRSHHLCRR